MIKYENGKPRYFDRNGAEITEGSRIRDKSGRVRVVYLTEGGDLGTDATNPAWIEKGWAVPCEFGIYLLTREDTEEVALVEYTVKQYFNGIHWDDSYTPDRAEAERWKAYMEDKGASVWDRVNGDALEQFVEEFHIIDPEQIEITVEIVEE